ncbi:MAG: Cobalamin-binding protein precursor [Methanosaeta sp. PtaU1.Bin060]|nr:MAG: Cobalamin-binding protein precursor [Methanosaeta sp. PtaU1.Bin060]
MRFKHLFVALIMLFALAMSEAVGLGYVLHVFGNANMDDDVNDQDLKYLGEIIEGKAQATALADADNNSKIDEADLQQVEKIINGTQSEITIIDSDNRTVTVRQPLERLVIYTHQCAEILQLLGAQDKIVGVRDTFAEQPNRFPEMSKDKNIGSGAEPDVEAVVNSRPDVILAYTFYPTEESLDAKLPSEIKVLRFDCECSGLGPDAMREKVKLLGILLGARDKAGKYLQWHDRSLSQVEDRVADISENDRINVYLESTPEGDKPLVTRTAIGSGHAASKLVEMAGGKNIASGHLSKYLDTTMEYGDIETEWVLLENPDVIVGRAMGKGIRPYENENDNLLQKYVQDIESLPGFDNISAVKNDRVYIITNDYAVTPNYPSALLLLAKWFYPDRFADLDPVAAHQEYVNMMGLDYDVRNKGAFVYPYA